MPAITILFAFILSVAAAIGPQNTSLYANSSPTTIVVGQNTTFTVNGLTTLTTPVNVRISGDAYYHLAIVPNSLIAGANMQCAVTSTTQWSCQGLISAAQPAAISFATRGTGTDRGYVEVTMRDGATGAVAKRNIGVVLISAPAAPTPARRAPLWPDPPRAAQ